MSETKTACDVAISLLQERLESRRKWVIDSQHEMSRLMDLELRGLDPNLILGGDGSTRGILDSVTRMQARYQDNIWLWFRLPFQVYRAGIHGHLQSMASSVLGDERLPETLRKELRHDTDDWILCNEKHLRSHSITRRAVAHRMYGVVWMEDLQQSLVADEICLLTDGTTAEQSIALKVSCSSIDSIPGYSVLTERRRSVVFLQPNIQRFRSTWDEITDKVLDGLDWDHVMVAGGIVLATLLCPSIPSEIHETSNAHTVEEWKSSDLDLYIYGLGPEEANEKIRHVASVYRSNLPQGFPFLVVRNSQTITLYSKWPHQRVQIVLKLISAPVDVLLNFDLDICSVGYNGRQVFMLPRFIWAVETGTNTFTMDLVNGHYLGERKATRDTRLFKYADKGYGLRFPISYITALGHDPWLVLSRASEKSRKWTTTCLDFYLRMLGTQKRLELRPTYSHSQLNSQMFDIPSRSNCLHNFSLFMRHVSLWELDLRGIIRLGDTEMAANSYSQTRGLEDAAYNDSPPFPWDENFDLESFRSSIETFNNQETEAFLNTFHWYTDLSHYLGIEDQLRTEKKINALRATCTSEVAEIFDESHDLIFPLIIDKHLLHFINRATQGALRRAGVSNASARMQPLTPVQIDLSQDPKSLDNPEILCLWRLNHVTNWQMMEHEMDEIREILWYFQRSNQLVDRKRAMWFDGSNGVKCALDNDRRIYSTPQNDLEAFAKWVSAPIFKPKAFAHTSSE